MENAGPASEIPAAQPKRWPMALLVALVTGVCGAVLAVPVSDWAMEAHHVSTREGGRACAAVGFFAPLAFIAGSVVGFTCGLLLGGSGLAGYLKRQAIALLAIAGLVCAVAGIAYASADHPPVIHGKTLALDIEVRVPTYGESIEELKANGFSVALLVSASDRDYADMRWSEATRTEEFITVPAWAQLRSRKAGREITVGIEGENRQIFDVGRPASPKSIDDAWTEWLPPRSLFDGTKPSAEHQYFVRYRVRFETEYSPTPHPPLDGEISPTPGETTPAPEAAATL